MSLAVTEYVHEDNQFYPTPNKIVEKMIDGVDFGTIETILEPSAGKGDILREIARYRHKEYHYDKFDIDCIEIDPNLRQILKYNFSSERRKQINLKMTALRDSRTYDPKTYKYSEFTASQKEEYDSLQEEEKTFFDNGIHIIHDDFLTYQPFKQYNLIIMNPPFKTGDKHLIKALEIQKNGGSVICLLNAETIKNPYNETRKHLQMLLNKYEAQIEFIQDGFCDSERKTDVEVALVKVFIEPVQDKSEIWNRLEKSEQHEEMNFNNPAELEVTDYIKAAINRFNVEVKSGLELIRQYKALKPYMSCSFDEHDYHFKDPILKLLIDNGKHDEISINSYLKIVRLKYWRALLSNKKFVGKLTSKLQSEYMEAVGRLADYDFSGFNIYLLSTEMNSQIKMGIEQEIIVMFDRLTSEHAWYPECAKNKHYYDGWKSNKAHKIGKKVIIPCYGIFDSWDGKPRTYEANGVLSDIEKILNYLDGGMTREVNLYDTLAMHFTNGITKNIECKYFKVTFYKKGTVHIAFTCPELIERFNIYYAKNKAWLPPDYGNKAYRDMNTEEKAVIDSFQGEEAYNKVLEKSEYYLTPVTNNQVLMLEG